MKNDAPTSTQLDSGTTKKRERNLRLVLVMISIATFLGLVSIGPSPQITPRTSAQAPSCVPPPAGLVSWWPGDGNTNDILDGNAGTLQNGATFAAGKVGMAFSVDGVDDYVEIPDTGNLSPAAITLDAWVNPDTLKGASTGTRIISKDVSASSCVSPFVVYSLEVRGDFGNKATFFFTTSDDVLHTLVGTSVIPIGSFSLLAATFDGSTARIYVNGALENSLAVSGTLRTSTAPVILGNAGAGCRAAAAGLVEFDGLIDEVEIFDRALFATEITAIFNAGIAGKCKGCATPPASMVGWWPGDNNANDITPSPDNGTLNGGATFASGEVAQAFSLNGTTAYVSAPSVAKINFGTGNFSIDAWIQTSNASTTQAIVDKRSGDNVSVFTGYHLFTFQGNLGVQLADGLGGGITATNFVSATNVANGVFNHVAVTVDRASTTGGHLYVNGVSVLTFDPTGRPGTLTNTAELRFGRNCPNTLADNFFNGLIDEVELFNVALTQPEVVAIYNAGSQGKCKCTTITCPANITVSNAPGQCGAVVTYPAPTASAGCGTINCVPASGSFFPVGTTTVNCSPTAGPSCTFTVTVNDTQPPSITCPANVTAVTNQNACPSPACQTVNFTTPTASDNCPGAGVVCNPPGGSCFPVGVTTVFCTATDASGNTATCSFTVTTFDVALQDDSNPSIILLWNSITGQYRFCCKGTTYTGVGKPTRQGCIYTLQTPTATDRRILGRHDKATHSGSGSLQSPPGKTQCTITDRNTLNDTLLPAC